MILLYHEVSYNMTANDGGFVSAPPVTWALRQKHLVGVQSLRTNVLNTLSYFRYRTTIAICSEIASVPPRIPMVWSTLVPGTDDYSVTARGSLKVTHANT